MKRGKIITTLRERREIEEQIRRLVDLKSEQEISEQLDAIAAQGAEVASAVLSNLDTTDPHFRGALGMVASRLPREAIAPALRAATRDDSLSDQARLTAMMILERFLDEEVDASALAGLRDPNQVAMQSLIEVTSECERDRTILIEYVRGLDAQPQEVTFLILDALQAIPPENQIDLLRMLAQHDDFDVSERALHLLSQNRTPQAVRALQALAPTLHPSAWPTLQRALRKLSLAGLSADPLPAPGPSWRVLVSPVDGRGNQSVWFLQERIEEQSDEKECRFLSVLINDQAGLQEAFGGERVTGQHFPEPAPVGTRHSVSLRESGFKLSLLEAGFDYGRRIVHRGLQLNFQRNVSTPLEYRLLNDFLWGYAFEPSAGAVEVPEIPLTRARALLARTAELLDLPDFATWFAQSEEIHARVHQLRRAAIRSNRPAAIPRHWLLELTKDHFADAATRETYRGRLQAMSEWLFLSRQEESAHLAQVAAAAIDEAPPETHPFLLRLVQRGLIIALAALTPAAHRGNSHSPQE